MRFSDTSRPGSTTAPKFPTRCKSILGASDEKQDLVPGATSPRRHGQAWTQLHPEGPRRASGIAATEVDEADLAREPGIVGGRVNRREGALERVREVEVELDSWRQSQVDFDVRDLHTRGGRSTNHSKLEVHPELTRRDDLKVRRFEPRPSAVCGRRSMRLEARHHEGHHAGDELFVEVPVTWHAATVAVSRAFRSARRIRAPWWRDA
jgi:hypothetical protein